MNINELQQPSKVREFGVNGENQQKSTMGDLDKDAFLQLLTTQLSNQDPLNPTEDREFIAQMAQFSSLEQMQNLNDTFKSEIKGIKESQESLAEHLTAMNNNMVGSQSDVVNQLGRINTSLTELIEGLKNNSSDDETSEPVEEQE
ncbi:flagellar hook capping protein [Isachenkonia alkalipeptolytica]|uniref:Flagellar hook capping protein n=1 Tax=Isachenkonia alkalipeptolytica TaxID=2565777 RepID=A0AA44BCR1_9CLOT|nr:flagellar hook capping FlgD N-terminal domain-containing protein [Isachenkonia alkalipeptolytica]NBG87569.1 flagellar hook capping protein [Isachenkonia alkalipeptolytica]